jgi:hypothetical protein
LGERSSENSTFLLGLIENFYDSEGKKERKKEETKKEKERNFGVDETVINYSLYWDCQKLFRTVKVTRQ